MIDLFIIMNECDFGSTGCLKHDNIAIDLIEDSAGLTSFVIFMIPFTACIEIAVSIIGRCLFLNVATLI